MYRYDINNHYTHANTHTVTHMQHCNTDSLNTHLCTTTQL